MDYIDQVYYTLVGELLEEYRIPGVENAFAPGSRCNQEYEQLNQACVRLRQRLAVPDEDGDVETILNSMCIIQHTLCRRMYELGAQT